jgi:hypothetical protein
MQKPSCQSSSHRPCRFAPHAASLVAAAPSTRQSNATAVIAPSARTLRTVSRARVIALADADAGAWGWGRLGLGLGLAETDAFRATADQVPGQLELVDDRGGPMTPSERSFA